MQKLSLRNYRYNFATRRKEQIDREAEIYTIHYIIVIRYVISAKCFSPILCLYQKHEQALESGNVREIANNYLRQSLAQTGASLRNRRTVGERGCEN